MKRIIYPLFSILIAVATPVIAFAEDENDPGGLPLVNDVPIDGGLSVLLAAGVGYGIKKVRDQRKNKKDIKLPE